MTINKPTDEQLVEKYAENLKLAAANYLEVSGKDVPYYDKAMARRPFDLLLHPSDLLKLIAAFEQRGAELQKYRKAASQPVGWTDEQELRSVHKDGCGYLFKANPISPNADQRRVIYLYASAKNRSDL